MYNEEEQATADRQGPVKSKPGKAKNIKLHLQLWNEMKTLLPSSDALFWNSQRVRLSSGSRSTMALARA